MRPESLVKIYSHPRSGTHFLGAFLGENFFPDNDLAVKPIYYGHWSNKVYLPVGERYGMLYGGHCFPDAIPDISHPHNIYIYRDGRDVAYSVWNAKFFNLADSSISFSQFLRKPIDWRGGPGMRCENQSMTIAQHWDAHIRSWIDRYGNSSGFLFLSFEELKRKPSVVYHKLFSFLNGSEIQHISNLRTIDTPVGILPNKGKTGTWIDVFTEDDEAFFLTQIMNDRFLDK